MTALAMPAGAGRPFAVAPARVPIPRAINWSQPEPWTVAFLLLTGIVVVGRHPIAQAIGTEVNADTASPSVVATAAPNPVVAPSHAAAAAAMAAVPTHAPRDPFAALVGAGEAVVAPDTGTATSAPVATPADTPATRPGTQSGGQHAAAGAGAASCSGTMHTVVAGDTLWSLAARQVKSADTGKVTVAWHRIYRANRPPLSDPSLLPVGTKICLPATH